MNYKGIIFDLDGVICHTDKYHYQAWKKLADRLGIYFDETINNRLRGVSRMESLNIILERADKTYTEQEKEAFATEKNEVYKELLKQMTPEELSPEVFLKAAEFLKLPASECLVVEDAEAGLLAAKNGGMDSAAIGDAVKSDLPQYKLKTFSDLLNI